ncbi:helix-turn-helix domain-containing protein [Macrococcoides canis]|uniref:helix-turn-helix domain-containing protein n=1 Tax=Macrococcoides canis TaxID=1855823 RepID=UPI0021CDB1DF|nr:AraC family transcriptional regulator [Macrococcus canis]
MSQDNINQIIELVEENLLENYTLDDYVKRTGYSKFHLMRMFKRATGYTFYDYIISRRIAYASQYLLYTDISIIDLAFVLNFQSQEAFSRRFKSVYGLPPGKYRKLMSGLTNDNKEEAVMTSENIKGWIMTGTAPHLYETRLDAKVFHSGQKSALLSSKNDDATFNENTFGTLMQSISAKSFTNKRVKFSAFIKTEAVDKCGVWARIDDAKYDILQFDNMMDRAIIGTNEWNYYSVVLDVSENAASMHFGVILLGKGKVWIDQFKVEEVDLSIPNADTLTKPQDLPSLPTNLDFEEC